MVDYTLYIPMLSIAVSTLGISVVFKDYVASLLAGIVIRKVKHIRPGGRIKLIGTPSIKGDIIDVGPLRTTLMEVGDGERLPSVQTGRLVKLPNSLLITNPVLVYGDTIIDEVVAYLSPPFPNLDLVEQAMKEAITQQGHRTIEVGLYQKEDHLVVHGVFEAATKEMTDQRSKILKFFLESTRGISIVARP